MNCSQAKPPGKPKTKRNWSKKIEASKIEDLLGKLNLGNSSQEFLKKCLKVDKHSRWDLENLENFSFASTKQTLPKILGEKQMNGETRSGFSRPSVTPKR